MDSQKEEGPAPLLWRFSDFLKWAELCPSEPEIGHALMRLVITGQEIPHACEVIRIYFIFNILNQIKRDWYWIVYIWLKRDFFVICDRLSG